MQGIEIPIGADLSQLKAAQKEIKDRLKQLADDAGKAGAGLGDKLVKGSNSAAFALTNLGRVAQDAPFGFIGIQNNLNPLLESFTQLKKETGSTGSALKALGQSLIGPAGLGIALSVVSAGILFYQQYQQRANKEVVTAKKVTDEYINSLNQVDQARLKGGQNAAAELTTLKLLYDQYQNAALPLEKRKEAYKEIQKLYPAYFGNLKFETSATDKTKTAYNGLTESILATARARAAADLITKNSTRQLENEQKVIDLNKQIQDERTKQLKLQAQVESQNLLAKQELNLLTSKQRDILNQYLKAGFQENELTKVKNNLLTDTNVLTEQNIQLQKAATAEVLKGGKISGSVAGEKLKETENEKRRFFALINDFKGIAETGKKEIAKTLSGGKPLIDINTLLSTKGFIPDNIGKQLYTPFQILQDNIKFDLLPQLGSSFKTFFDDILMNGNFSFSALGQAIKNTFLSVIASEAAQGVLNLLGSKGGKTEKGGGLLAGVIGLFGATKKAAPLANIAKSTGGILGSAATLTAPVAATGGALLPILAGVTAIAGIASLFKKKQQAPIPQASSTISTSAAGSSQDFGGGRVVFEISGTNLIGVLNRAGAKLQRFGP
jgi:hypothetical protein